LKKYFQSTVYQNAYVLSEAQLIDASENCPICDGSDPRELLFKIQHDPEIGLLPCRECDGCSASRMPTPETLAGYYSQYYRENDERVTFAGTERFARHIIRGLCSYTDPAHTETFKILDFGGGDGSLSKKIAEIMVAEGIQSRPIEIVLVELQEVSPSSTDSFVLTATDSLERVDGAFHLVLASAILEHIPDLRSVLPTLLTHVSEGGIFYARTPYMVPFKKIFRWLNLTYPGHVHDLGPRFWGKAHRFADHGMSVAVSRPSPVETSFRTHPIRTSVVYLLKAPAHLERLANKTNHPRWPFVGGWEVFLSRASSG
jgi:SAM-dependent methyltransferase